MAGVMTMASVIEDFETQPCKPSRQDGSSPVVKTITNYFSPVSKPVEKPFSPPRSNNIMDYFSRKVQSSGETTSTPEQYKGNNKRCQSADKHTSPEVAVKRPFHKRARKASKAVRTLIGPDASNSSEDVICLNADEPGSRDTAADTVSSCAVLGSDTAALLAQLSADVCVIAEISDRISVEHTEKRDEICSRPGSHLRLTPEVNSNEASPDLPSKCKAKLTKVAPRNPRKKQQKETKRSDPEAKEADKSLCDDDMEVSIDEASELNSSTVTISFEDFVRSQSQDHGEAECGQGDESKEIGEVEEMETNQLNVSKDDENLDSLQASPRTLTIKADVHVSPKQEAGTTVGKIASIFTMKKATKSLPELESSPHRERGHQHPSSSLTVKRKSNVVLEEEDLELAVLESESTPKCSEAERKQFIAAFKQPTLDGSKGKPSKSQTKQKQRGEKTVDDAEQDVIPLANEQECAAVQEKAVAKKKLAGKGKKKVSVEKEKVTASDDAVEETVEAVVVIDDKMDDLPVTSTPPTPAVRRSRRVAGVKQVSGPTTEDNVPEAGRQCGSKKGVLQLDTPVKMSTPKTRKSKHGVFSAEIVCPPDTKQSPIRIKFSRVHRNVSVSKSAHGSNVDTLSASKEAKLSDNSKKRNQAKKLVEKAKAVQKSKRAAVEVKSTRRHSLRTEASVRKSYCEDEDSVICMEEDESPSASAGPGKSQSQKALRSLNEVLGKNTKALPVAPLVQDKTSRKASAIVSIFDETANEASENLQVNEELRARREFLKSGLPESFKKQIAKTAATKEAYSLSCSTFQTVTHIKQPTTDCPLWGLPWPGSSLLHHLRETWCQTFSPLPSLSGGFALKTKPACRTFCQRGSGWRSEFSESLRLLLMEEIGASNTSFPVQLFFTRLQKRRSDHLQLCTTSEAVTKDTKTQVSAEPARGKRKRMGEETSVKLSKKQRSDYSEENLATLEVDSKRRGGRTRRSRRLEEDKVKESAEIVLQATPVSCEDDSVVILDDAVLGGDTEKQDVMTEDVLWTDKYRPHHSTEIIGNATAVKKLYNWLKEWKLCVDQEEKKKQKVNKQEEGNNDSDWECEEEVSRDDKDTLCNTLLITGPTGVGKTAAVYACAQELGFKVFEVNASSQRSGRLILSQLKEATQSHQVDSQGVNVHKPTYFNSQGTCSSVGAVRPGSSPRKTKLPRQVVSSPVKQAKSPRSTKRGNLTPTSLATFFKTGRPTNKEPPDNKTEQTVIPKKSIKANSGASNATSPKSTTLKENDEEQSKKTATSLILFEEVDVIFDDDAGFLAAIKTFMTTTKRPVILTTSDAAFSTVFDGIFEEIHFKTPSLCDISSYLQLLCLAEDMRTDPKDISSLLALNSCDIRRTLLQLQFWARSAGGHRITRPQSYTNTNEAANTTVCDVTVPTTLPACDTGCTESMLGLLNTEAEAHIWDLLRNHSLLEKAACWELLTDSRRRGVDLLYANMEMLLPLPLTHFTHKPKYSVSLSPDHPAKPADLPSTCPLSESLSSQVEILRTAQSAESSDDGSPIKVSNRMRKSKRRHCVLDQHGLFSGSDSEDGFLSLYKPLAAPRAKEEVKEKCVFECAKRKSLTPEELKQSLPVAQCLESMSFFLDNMSYLDSSLLGCYFPVAQKKMLPGCLVVKDGMTDESRIDCDSDNWVRSERMLEIQATVEALSFHKCRVALMETWNKAQQLEGELGKNAAADLAFPVAPHVEGCSFTQGGPCHPRLIQQRREVTESLIFRGVFGTLGNKPAAVLDYLPALRNICRSEQFKEQGKVKRRFLHYLDAVHLGLDKTTLQHLADDFP
ncbi:ATPase family AAA domain-containing protein 5 [Thalassophryne amazonica]|uniref:ATPase family AAA domain-containing protein 5 n=1 Tax=Thalassophryne amazonica TaxID=390379 RepID=UPI0014721A3E|nr:ATPase family AAA domain-containing protein 5 [Thalassophryne amazonica]